MLLFCATSRGGGGVELKQGGGTFQTIPSDGLCDPVDNARRIRELRTLIGRNRSTRESFRIVSGYMQQMEKGMDSLRREVEEWGTLNVSSPMFAAPEFMDGTTRNAAFPFGFEKDANDWFVEAGKSEGSVQFLERIFNTFMLAGTLQASPDEAFAFSLKKKKLETEQQLFDAELTKKQLLEEEALADHATKRTQLAEASQLQITVAREEANRALLARQEAEIISQKQQSISDAAQSLLTRRKAELAIAVNAAAANPADEIVQARLASAQRARDDAQTAATVATGDLTAAKTEMERRQATESAAQTKLATALTNAPASPPSPATSPFPPLRRCWTGRRLLPLRPLKP